jgi:hypothetical protein
MIKLKTLLNEELLGEYKGYEIYKNPKSIKRMQPNLRAVSFSNGDLFVVDDNSWHMTHLDLRDGLNKLGYKNPPIRATSDIFDSIKKGLIDWQRKEKNNTFYLSESIDFNDGAYEHEIYDEKEYMPYIKKYVNKVKQKNPQYKFILETKK